MFQDLTFQQFCALDYDRNIVVTAGPGAGKTRILSHRFCFIILTDDSVTIPQILTLTFTEKAAEEMKSRIYGMLGQLAEHIRLKGDRNIRSRIIRAMEGFNKNRISTIHSFCANLLREHPIESGVDPGFTIIKGVRKEKIMDQALEKGISYLWQRNKDKLLPLLQSFGNHNGLLTAVRNMIEHPLSFMRVRQTSQRLFNTDGWDRQIFKEYCRYIMDSMLSPYITGLKKRHNSTGKHEKILSILEDWYENGEDGGKDFNLPSLFQELRKFESSREESSSRASITNGLKTISYVDLLNEFFPDLFFNTSPDVIFKEQFNTFLELADTCLKEYDKEKFRINSLDFADLEAKSHTFLRELLESDNQHELKMIQEQFRYVMVDEFQDTNRDQWEIIRILCSDRSLQRLDCLQPGKLFVVGDKRQAIYKFRGGDVTVFESVTKEIKESNPKVSTKMFWEKSGMIKPLVKAKIFNTKVINEYQKSFEALRGIEKKDILDGDIYLPHNFRACSSPVFFINKIFNAILGNKQAKDQRDYETAPRDILIPEGKRDASKEEGSVSLYLSRSKNIGMGKAESAAVLVTEIIESILGIHGKDSFEYNAYPDIREKIETNQIAIGILFFSFSNIKVFENILREASIPFSIHKGKGFFRCSEIMDIVQLLKYINDYREQISLLSAVRSPIFALSDPEIFDLFYGNNVTPDLLISSENSRVKMVGEQIRSWRLLSNNITLTELIRKIISDRQLTAIHSAHVNGIQILANLEKFTEIARRFQEDGNGSLHEFVEYCIDMAEQDEEEGEALIKSGNESPINLMTIHASKGLEFPMVIIPDLDRKIPNRPKNGKPVRLYSEEKAKKGSWNSIDGEIPVWPVEIPALSYSKELTPLGYLLMKRNRLEDVAENRRVFYVGCTRAETHLILAGHMSNKLMRDGKCVLTTEDYKDGASIMDLLNDIHQFSLNYPPDQAELNLDQDEKITVIWKDPNTREYKGYEFGKEKISKKDIGEYDNNVKGLDFTNSIISPPYIQLSFHSIQIYRKCPLRFFYNVILGVRSYDSAPRKTTLNEELKERLDPEEDILHEYKSGEALLLGGLVHGYLEKHRFGNRFDINLMNRLWQRYNHNAQEYLGLSKENSERVKEKACRHLETTVNDAHLLDLFRGKRELAEVPFLFSLSNGCEFRGVIDRLIKKSNTGWTIIDWKSNDLRGKDPDQVALDNGYNLQIACYKWAVEHLTNEKVENCYIYFTDKGTLIECSCDEDPARIVNDILVKTRENGTDRKKWIQEQKTSEYTLKECYNCEYKEDICKAERN